MNMHEQLTNARVWTDLALGEHGLETGIIPVSWNGRLTSTMGRALCRQDPYTRKRCVRIELSPRLFERATQDQRDETAAHEAAHGVVWLVHGPLKRGRSQADHHGPVWQHTMRSLGFEPNRCHSVSTAGLGRKSHRLTCGLCGASAGVCGRKKAARLQSSPVIRLRCCGHQSGSVLRVQDLRGR